MTDLIFDIETNGFLADMTMIHCIWAEDAETGQRWDFGPTRITDGVRLLQKADRLIGHNILKFDIPAINKLFPGALPLGIDDAGTRYIDTLVLSRLAWADIRDTDFDRRKSPSGAAAFPGRHVGSHALEAWGYRLGVLKGEYGKDANGKSAAGVWTSWNQEMHDYCGQDVTVTKALWERIKAKALDPRATALEHEFAFVISLMEAHGFGFDQDAAVALYSTLVARRQALASTLASTFPTEVVEETRIARVNNKTKGWVKGQSYVKRTEIVFNPSSRQQIARRLQAMGWVPQEFTDNGQPKVDETILAALPYPEAKLLSEYFLIEKRIGQIAEGDQAWLKLVRNGRIHGSVNTNGAVTGRCTHSNPNVAQVPKVGTPYGQECRGLFLASTGLALVGADLSGLELRCLAHFMASFDGGLYGRILLEGDIHWANVKAMGLTDADRDDKNLAHKLYRDKAKTFIYAFLYGCGDHKAGSIVLDLVLALKDAGLAWEQLALRFFNTLDPPSDQAIARAGKKLKASFLTKTPALQRLRAAVDAKVRSHGCLKGLDGRVLRIRSSHAALNTLLQSAGALIAKLATVIAYRKLTTLGLTFGKDWALLAHVHDEMQIEARKEVAEVVGRTAVEAMKEAGAQFGFRLPIDGEYKVGTTWASTH